MDDEQKLETKTEYCDRVALIHTKEMGPFLEELVEPCYCGSHVCRGWKLRTMWRDELPPDALARRPIREIKS